MQKLIFLLLFLPLSADAQELNLLKYNQDRLKVDKTLMLTLSSWSAANIGVSAYGWATAENEAKYFHQMNTIWAGINLALALPGYIKALRTDPNEYNFAKTVREQHKTEKIFTFNTALDVGYVATGLLMRGLANPEKESYHQLKGFGSGIILQGGFLLLLDATAIIIHSRHNKKQLNPFFDKIELSDNGIGLKLRL